MERSIRLASGLWNRGHHAHEPGELPFESVVHEIMHDPALPLDKDYARVPQKAIRVLQGLYDIEDGVMFDDDDVTDLRKRQAAARQRNGERRADFINERFYKPCNIRTTARLDDLRQGVPKGERLGPEFHSSYSLKRMTECAIMKRSMGTGSDAPPTAETRMWAAYCGHWKMRGRKAITDSGNPSGTSELRHGVRSSVTSIHGHRDYDETDADCLANRLIQMEDGEMELPQEAAIPERD